MLRSLKIWQKLAVFAGLMAIPVLTLVYLFVQSRNEQIQFAEKEVAGTEYLDPVRHLLNHIPLHRAAANAFLNGDATMREQMSRIAQQVDSDIQAVETADGRLGAQLGTKEQWQAVKSGWTALKTRAATLGPAQSFDQHTKLVADLVELVRLVGDKSNLILDPDLDTYYLAAGILAHIAPGTESVSQLSGYAAGVSVRGRATPEESAQMIALGRQAAYFNDSSNRHITSAIRYNSTLDSKLSDPLRQATDSFQRLNQSVGRGAVISGRAAFDMGTQAGNDNARLFEVANAQLRDLLNKRADRLTREKNLQVAVALLIALLALGVVYWLSKGITNQVNAILRMFSQVGVGDYTARSAILGNDELGSVAATMNTMLDNTLTLIQSREERDNIQASIRKLLEEVSGVAEGDLSKEAEVTEDMTGAIADSFNYMIVELRQLISQVQRTTNAVANNATQVQTTTESLASGSVDQASQILETSKAVEQMTQSIQEVSKSATKAATVAEQALSNARQGAETVTKTIDGMNSIRTQVQETAKRIKRLGESSQEIGEIVQLIRDIADRTSILALNASIQAAMAGEAGKGFAVVAEEVERLAERAAESTKRISSLIQSVQSDTNEAVTAMEETTREVVGGSELANAAGQKLSQIELVSREITELVRSISSAAEHQASSSVQVSRNIGSISKVSLETADGARQTAQSIRKLAVLAEELSESVSRFKLPAGMESIAA